MTTSMLNSDTEPHVSSVVPSVLLRLMLAVIGVSLIIAAFGLWLVPGAQTAPELSLIKLGASLIMLIGGLCSLVCARAHDYRYQTPGL